MAMRLSISDFCSSCLEVHLGNDAAGPSVKEMLLSPGYVSSIGPSIANYSILYGLEDNGGCLSCINMVRRATE